ncbi:MAG TPA: MerR family transcriptional regulator, partial [Thermomicrobiales bacterium]|nr:MerR family transcriptional regulator [Thermomicrobiales bacterium]
MSELQATGRTVGEVAQLAGTTVRALHHYESIGLLLPSARSEAGYRLYAESDIDRLARILYYRELGFPLNRIRSLLDDPGSDPLSLLDRQRELLIERIGRIEALVAAIDRERTALMNGYNLTAEEKLEVFGNFNPDDYDAEATERWGDTDAWAQSRQRTARYNADDWLRIKTEADAINQRFVAMMSAGTPPTSVAAMDLAEEHRRHISQFHY